MKNKLKYLTKISLKKKIGTKWFKIANIVLFIVVAGLINIDNVVKFFGGDFNKKTEIFVVDNTDYVYESFKSNYEELGNYIEDFSPSEITLYTGDIEVKKEELKENKNQIILIVDKDENNFINAQVITYEGIDTIIYQIITTSLNQVKTNIALNYYNITLEKLAIIDTPVVIEKTRVDEGKTTDEMMELVMSVAFPIMILPFFMLTMFLVQMIGAEINEEKTTRGMEIIISNVPPKIHFFSKLISSNVFVIVQGLLLLVYAGIGIILRTYLGGGSILGDSADQINSVIQSLTETGFMSNLIYIIPITLVLMIVTFVAYSLLAGILASMTTNLEDYQQVQSPIIIISVIGYYLSIMAAMFEGSIFIKVLSYIPFLSSLLSPALLVLGQISIFDVLISLAILLVFIWFLFKYGLKIYKVGILNYSSTNLWRKIFKAAKN